MRTTLKQGFTLVELIVVVTILAILGTIGFISYNGYLLGVRDSNRLTQLDQVSSGLELYRSKNNLPLPGSSIRVEASGGLIGYQGYATQDILDLIDYSKGGKDPKDNINFTYYVSGDKKYFQLLGFLEDVSNQSTSFLSINQAHAADYTNRYFATSGKKLGIYVDSFQTPIQESQNLSGTGGEFDLSTQTNNFEMVFSDKNTIEGTGGQFIAYNYQATCKRIKETGGNRGNGYYATYPKGNTLVNVYCEMTTDGGGWTLIGRSVKDGSSATFGFNSSVGTVTDDSIPYSLGIIAQGANFTEIMFGNYVSGKDLGDRVYKFTAPTASLAGLTATATGITTSTIRGLATRCTGPGGNNGALPTEVTFVGHTTAKTNGFHIYSSATNTANTGLSGSGFTFSVTANGCANGELNGTGATNSYVQGMIFTR